MYGVWSPGSNFHALNSFQCYSKLNLYIFIFPNFLHAPWPFPCISLFISLFPVLNCRRWVHKEYSTLYTSISSAGDATFNNIKKQNKKISRLQLEHLFSQRLCEITVNHKAEVEELRKQVGYIFFPFSGRGNKILGKYE